MTRGRLGRPKQTEVLEGQTNKEGSGDRTKWCWDNDVVSHKNIKEIDGKVIGVERTSGRRTGKIPVHFPYPLTWTPKLNGDGIEQTFSRQEKLTNKICC